MGVTGPGLYVYRAQKSSGAGELDVAFLATEQAGSLRLSPVAESGETVQQGGVDQSYVATIRAAVEHAGGVCVIKTTWRHEIKRVHSKDGLLVLHTRTDIRQPVGTSALHEPAATALRRLLRRDPGRTSLVPKAGGASSAAGHRTARTEPLGTQGTRDRTGCYVLSASRCCPGRGKMDVPLVCRRDEGGDVVQLDGITASGALLPREQSKAEVLGATARAWGWQPEDVPVRTSWHNLATRVYLLDGEWKALGPGGLPADKVQAAAAQALSSFLQQHPWAADLSRPVGKRAKRAQPEGAAAADDPRPRAKRRSSSPAASGSPSDGGRSSSSASWADPAAERAVIRAQKRRLDELKAGGAAARATPTSSSHPASAEEPAAAQRAAQPAEPLGAATPEPPAAAEHFGPYGGAGLAAWDWGGGSAGRGSPPPPTAAQLGGLPAMLQPPQEAARYQPWDPEAEARSLREGNQALAAENARLRQVVAGARQAQRRLAELQARKQHLKARKAELQQQLQRHKAREQRVRQALEEE